MTGIHASIMLGGIMVFLTTCVLSFECEVKVGLKSSKIAFEAQMYTEKDEQIVPANASIMFNTVLLNDGNAYNPGTGVFTAPLSAVYRFSAQLCHTIGRYVLFAIMKGNEQLTTSWIANDYSYGCGSVITIVKLLEGDEVNVLSKYDDGSYIFSNPKVTNSFTGHFLYTK